MNTSMISFHGRTWSLDHISPLRNLFQYIQKYRYELISGTFAVIISNIFGLLPPWFIKLAIDHIGNPGSEFRLTPYLPFQTGTNPLVICSVLIIAVVGVQTVFRYIWRRHLLGISRNLEYDLRNDYFRHLQKLHQGFFQHTRTGDIMSRSTNDLQAVTELVGVGLVTIVDSAIMISACLIMMTLINARLTVASLVPMIVVSFIVMRFSGKIKLGFESIQEQVSAVSSMVQENAAGIRVIQAYAQEDNELHRFKKLNQELIRKRLSLTKVSALFFPFMAFATGATTALILWLGGKEVILGHLTLGSYVAFNGYLAMLIWPIAAVGYVVTFFQRGIASMQRIEEFMVVKPEIYDRPEIVKGQPQLSYEYIAGMKEKFKGKIEFRSLSFSYDGTKSTLSGIDLMVREGCSLSLVGPVGSGKSTLVRLIPRIYDPSDGLILIDGTDIKKMPVILLRELIGYVDQEPFLFSDTIKENIVFGAANISEDDIDRVTVIAGLDREMEVLPQGLNTVIGERGVTLSGGQKQRIALARAIIKKPKILILDDAFSHLDASTEERVCANIKSVFKHSTIILISHRISTIKQADTIAIMEDGRITETGLHDELILRSGLYNRIYKKQLFLENEIIEE